MKLKLIAVLFLAAATPAWASDYNQTITAIFGTGNPNSGWTSDTEGSLQIALRAKNTMTGNTTNTNGVYSFPTGIDGNGHAVWNYEFSVNSNVDGSGGNLQALPYYNYVLFYDTDPTLAGNTRTPFDLSSIPDNQYGTNTTANGAGVKGSYITEGPLYNIMQNSENISFYPFSGNPNIAGVYDFELGVYESDDNTFMHPYAFTSIRVIVGSPSVPDSGTTVALLGLSVIGMVGFGFRKRLAKI